MNLLHMKYALVVAEKHSINKAAQQLIVGAPALSRAVKELENSLGVILFERSVKGMTLTPDGELFVMYAKISFATDRRESSIFPYPFRARATYPPPLRSSRKSSIPRRISRFSIRRPTLPAL